MLENNVPVFLVTFATQELLLFRNAKTGEAVVGSEDAVDSCRYAIVLTRMDKELDNELTGGWKVVEVSNSGTTFPLCADPSSDGSKGDQELRVIPHNPISMMHHHSDLASCAMYDLHLFPSLLFKTVAAR